MSFVCSLCQISPISGGACAHSRLVALQRDAHRRAIKASPVRTRAVPPCARHRSARRPLRRPAVRAVRGSLLHCRSSPTRRRRRYLQHCTTSQHAASQHVDPICTRCWSCLSDDSSLVDHYILTTSHHYLRFCTPPNTACTLHVLSQLG